MSPRITNETPAQKFERVAEIRANAVLDKLRLLGNCSNKRLYSYTEEQLEELGFHYEVGRAHYYEIARNQIVGNDAGMFKILFHLETLEILGIHIIGRGATENIHIGQVAMTFNARIDYFIDQVFNYPTYAEGYRIAALNGFNKIKHWK